MSAEIHDLAAARKARDRKRVAEARRVFAESDSRILENLRETLARLKAAAAAVRKRLT